ncbi:MAG: hypothetical protein ACC645_21450, partial [Pirellulales bacterium]
MGRALRLLGPVVVGLLSIAYGAVLAAAAEGDGGVRFQQVKEASGISGGVCSVLGCGEATLIL